MCLSGVSLSARQGQDRAHTRFRVVTEPATRKRARCEGCDGEGARGTQLPTNSDFDSRVGIAASVPSASVGDPEGTRRGRGGGHAQHAEGGKEEKGGKFREGKRCATARGMGRGHWRGAGRAVCVRVHAGMFFVLIWYWFFFVDLAYLFLDRGCLPYGCRAHVCRHYSRCSMNEVGSHTMQERMHASYREEGD